MNEDLNFRLRADSRQAVLGTRQFREELGRVGASARQATGGLQGMSGAAAAASSSSSAMGYRVQNAAFQIGDFAVQVGAGTAASRALALQLPQLLGGFGVFGAVAGAAAAILLPLSARLFDTAEGGDAAADAMERYGASMSDVQGDVSALVSLQTKLNEVTAAHGPASKGAASAVIANTKAEIAARRQRLQVEIQILNIEGREARQQLVNLRQQQENARRAIQETLRNFSTQADPRDAPRGLVQSGLGVDDYLGRAEQFGVGSETLGDMRGRTKAILDLQVQLAEMTTTADEARMALDGVFVTDEGLVSGDTLGLSAGGSGGGKKSRTKAIKEQMTALQELLAVTKGTLSQQLGAWDGYFSNLAALTGTNNRKLLGIAKSFGAAQALIDAWGAHNKVLNDPTLPWWARIASAAQVLAAGLGAVNAIKSVTASEGGGGGGGGSRRAGGGGGGGGRGRGGAGTRPLQANINFTGPLAEVFAQAAGPMFDALNKEAGARGLHLTVST